MGRAIICVGSDRGVRRRVGIISVRSKCPQEALHASNNTLTDTAGCAVLPSVPKKANANSWVIGFIPADGHDFGRRTGAFGAEGGGNASGSGKFSAKCREMSLKVLNLAGGMGLRTA